MILSIIIPVYNEEKTIVEVLKKIKIETFEFKLFENIVKSYPKYEGAVDFVKLKMENVYHDYIAPLEPKIFIDNYERLSGIK